MPAVRPYWKGYIKLALVSCPIGLWTASSSSERVAFRQINKKTGNRLRQQLVDDETREPVEAREVAALKAGGCNIIRSEKRSGTSTAGRGELRSLACALMAHRRPL